MTIQNLSGNFQPPSDDRGKTLPPLSQGAASTSSVDNTVSSAASPISKGIEKPQETNFAKDEKPAEEQQDVKSQIEEFTNYSQSIDRSLQFKVDEDLGVTIVRVIDRETDELIRQFPPEELINLSKRLKELNEDISSQKTGILIQKQV